MTSDQGTEAGSVPCVSTLRPFIDPDSDHPDRPVCGICPSLCFPRDRFVVYDRPTREAPFNPEDGRRYTVAEGIPACVHPDKIGLEPDRTAPAAVPESPEGAVTQPGRRKRRWSFLGR
jgi:hypothetical protein